MHRAALTTLVVCLLVPSGVLADVVSLPMSCPSGSAPEGCHGPETCAPVSCTTDGDCEGDDECRELSLCTREQCCSGRRCAGAFDAGAPPRFATHVSGMCDDACTTGCETLRVCVPRSGGDDAGTGGGGGGDGGCGCSTVSTVDVVSMLPLLGLAFAFRRRQ